LAQIVKSWQRPAGGRAGPRPSGASLSRTRRFSQESARCG
jgi:hypothetical protein